MATTNNEIIFRNSIKLMNDGILKTTGRTLIIKADNGQDVEIPEPETIHTYAGWQELGYQVKKGEHAKAAFAIWKYTSKTDEETGEEIDSKLFQKKAFWFTFDQVEKK